jgi:hypothetical protein
VHSLRGIAAKCRLPYTQKELLDLARRYDNTADHIGPKALTDDRRDARMDVVDHGRLMVFIMLLPLLKALLSNRCRVPVAAISISRFPHFCVDQPRQQVEYLRFCAVWRRVLGRIGLNQMAAIPVPHNEPDVRRCGVAEGYRRPFGFHLSAACYTDLFSAARNGSEPAMVHVTVPAGSSRGSP